MSAGVLTFDDVLVPTIEAVPERIPTTSAAGNLSLKKLAKKDRTAFYNQLVVWICSGAWRVRRIGRSNYGVGV